MYYRAQKVLKEDSTVRYGVEGLLQVWALFRQRSFFWEAFRSLTS